MASADPDSTAALIEADLPSVAVPNYPRNPDSDSEEEVFFGPRRSFKERYGKNAKFNRRPTLAEDEILAARRRSYQTDGGDKENEDKGEEASKWRQRKTMFRVETSIEEEEGEEDEENDPPRLQTKKFPGDGGDDVLTPLQELQLTGSSADAEVSYRTDRSRSPLASKRLSSNNTSAVSDSAESVFRERRGLERPPRPVEVVAETPNVTVTNNGGNDDSLNSSTASQWFNNTHDEMVLFERYGDDYERVVGAMTTEELRRLKREVDGQEAKTVIELLGRELVEAEGDLQRVRTPSPTPREARSPDIRVQPPTPKPRTQTPKKKKQQEEEEEKAGEAAKWSPRQLESGDKELKELRDDLALALSGDALDHDDGDGGEDEDEAEEPSPSLSLSAAVARERYETYTKNKQLKEKQATMTMTEKEKYSTYTKKPAADKFATYTKKQSPMPSSPKTPAMSSRTPEPNSKQFKTPMSTGYGARSKAAVTATTLQNRHHHGHHGHRQQLKPSYQQPTRASKIRSSPRKTPGQGGALEVSICQRHGYAHTPQQEMPSLPRRPRLPANLDLDKIRSPVAHYIKNSPAPPLLRTVKPSAVKKNAMALRDAIAAEAEEAPCDCHIDDDFASLPEAVYRSSNFTSFATPRDEIDQ